MNQTKFFTVREADQMLPLVRRIVSDILAAGQALRALSLEPGNRAEESPEMHRLMDQLDELFEEMEELGCHYKDWNFSVGLVDFPAILDGKEVLLCWRSDEESVKYCHGVEEGFAGRKLITE